MTFPRICAAGAALALAAAGAQAASFTPTYFYTFQDATTGDNQFLATDGNYYWFIDAGADDHEAGVWERPTDQAYERVTAAQDPQNPNVTPGQEYLAAEKYYEYLDIVEGRFGFDSRYMYFSIELWGDSFIDESGEPDQEFGSGTHYNVHLSNDPTGNGGLMIGLDGSDGEDLPGDWFNNASDPWQSEKAHGHLDTLAPDGVLVGNDYDVQIIDDGEIDPTEQLVLWARLMRSADDRPLIELAFDHVTFNSLYPDFALDLPLTLEDILYINFETARGLKSNYNWYPHYSLAEAGDPYDDDGLGNVYQVDNIRGAAIVPLPAAAWTGLALGGLMLAVRRRMFARA